MRKHLETALWLIFAAGFILLFASNGHGQRPPGSGRTPKELPYPYTPATGITIAANLHYTVQVLASQTAPQTPRTEPTGLLRVPLWRYRNGQWCETEAVYGTNAEQPISTFHFLGGDLLMLEQWDGYRFVIRGYDKSNSKVSEVVFAGGPTLHGQPIVPMGCN